MKQPAADPDIRPGQSVELLKERVPDTRVEIIPGVGHFTQLEAPEEVSRLVRTFAGSL